MEKPKRIEIWSLCIAIVGATVGIATFGTAIRGLGIAKDALKENTKLRYMALQEELYANERWWYERMSDFPYAYSLWSSFDSNTKPEDYIRTCIKLASPGEGAELPTPRDIDDLMRMLWHTSTFNDSFNTISRASNLRRAFDIAEVIFYHLERIHAYMNDEIMDDEEANTWLGIVQNIGPHPLFLAAAEDARRHGYISPDFAQWLLDALSTNPKWKLVQDFYPYMAKTPDKWIADFKREEMDLRFSHPKGKGKR